MSIDRDSLDSMLISRCGQTSAELGFDDDMLDAGWMGFDTLGDFVTRLDNEFFLISRCEQEVEGIRRHWTDRHTRRNSHVRT